MYRKQDWSGILALSVVYGAFGIAFYQLHMGHEDGAHVPPWISAMVGSVITFYFVKKNGKK